MRGGFRGRFVFLFFLLGVLFSPITFAQNQDDNSIITIRLQTAYPLNLQYLGSLPGELSTLVKEMTNGKVVIQVYAPGALVDTLSLEKSVNEGKIDAAFSGLAYAVKEQPATELLTSVPFGLTPMQYAGWMYQGGGIELLNNYFANQNLVVMPGILLPPESSGWFKKEINHPQDLQGLKIRAYGLARPIFEALGAKTVMMPADQLYEALKIGKLDAAEFSAPSVDQNLKLNEVTKYLYFPGFHQPSTFLFLYFNKKMWDNLPPQYQAIIKTASRYLVFDNYLSVEASQQRAVELLKTKVHIRNWSPEMLQTYRKAWNQTVETYSKTDPNFKKILQSMQQYQKQTRYWEELNSALRVK